MPVLEIRINFDLEDGPLDPIDLLGDVRLSDGRSTIALNTTFVDTWLVALIKVLPRLRAADHVIAENPEEPIPLRIDLDSDGRVLISNEDGAVVARSVGDLENALRGAAGQLLQAVGDHTDAQRNPDLAAIRQFYETSAN